MKQRYFSMVILLSLCFSVTAENRSEQEILNIAAKQLNANRGTGRGPLTSAKNLQIIIDREELSVVTKGGTGLVVVAKDKAVDPVLGYSPTCNVTDDTLSMPDGFKWWLEETAATLNAGTATASNVPEGMKESVEPLLKTKWSQATPYNKYCPYDVSTTDKKEYRAQAGCVATAMAQILYYYKGFTHGVGTHGYSYTHNGYSDEAKTKLIKVTDYLEFDFENTAFDWDNMLESYEYRLDIFPNDTVEVTNYTEEQANAIATLMYACGVAADMQYGVGASSSNIANSLAGLSRNFGYKYGSYLAQSSVNKTTWNKKVYGNLSKGRPLIYGGAPSYYESGHAFILDGYDADGLVHVNWGWNGGFDGYYNMWNLYISNGWVNDYSKRHEMICDIYAPDAQPEVRTIHVAKAGTLPQLLPQDEWNSLEVLKLTGELNGADFEVLRMLCGRDINDNPTSYSLMHLDLSDADIVDGDEPYRVITIGGTTTTTYKYYTYDDRFPAYAFAQCTGLSGITLPRSITRIEDGDASGYASSSDRGAFSQCTGLKEIVIPDGVTWIGNSTFTGCI